MHSTTEFQMVHVLEVDRYFSFEGGIEGQKSCQLLGVTVRLSR